MRLKPTATITAVGVLAAMALPSAAAGLTIIDDATGVTAPVYQRWASRAFVPTAPETIRLVAARCPFGPEIACTRSDVQTIWLDPSWANWDIFTHEIGHRFDYRVMSDVARDQFRRLIGDKRPWRTSPSSPHEKFADAYGLCVRHKTIRRQVDAGYDYVPTPRMHRRVCRLIRLAAAGAYGPPTPSWSPTPS